MLLFTIVPVFSACYCNHAGALLQYALAPNTNREMQMVSTTSPHELTMTASRMLKGKNDDKDKDVTDRKADHHQAEQVVHRPATARIHDTRVAPWEAQGLPPPDTHEPSRMLKKKCEYLLHLHYSLSPSLPISTREPLVEQRYSVTLQPP